MRSARLSRNCPTQRNIATRITTWYFTGAQALKNEYRKTLNWRLMCTTNSKNIRNTHIKVSLQRRGEHEGYVRGAIDWSIQVSLERVSGKGMARYVRGATKYPS